MDVPLWHTLIKGVFRLWKSPQQLARFLLPTHYLHFTQTVSAMAKAISVHIYHTYPILCLLANRCVLWLIVENYKSDTIRCIMISIYLFGTYNTNNCLTNWVTLLCKECVHKKTKQSRVLLIFSTLCHIVCKVGFPGVMPQPGGILGCLQGRIRNQGCLLCKACCLSSKNIPTAGASRACWGPAVYHEQDGYRASCILDACFC